MKFEEVSIRSVALGLWLLLAGCLPTAHIAADEPMPGVLDLSGTWRLSLVYPSADSSLASSPMSPRAVTIPSSWQELELSAPGLQRVVLEAD